MGLTIHYKITAPAGLDTAAARQLVKAGHRLTWEMWPDCGFRDVYPISSDWEASKEAVCFVTLPHPHQPGKETWAEVRPTEWFLFPIEVGDDCEPLWLGLCRYPATELLCGHKFKTHLSGRWRFARFSKTQFASIHGWEHFLRCHRGIIQLLVAWRGLGLRVDISDEGEYWPRRSVTALRRNLDEMNGVVAAAAGALRDMDPAAGTDAGVQSPIFAHPRFEHLEAEGAARGRASALRKALSS